MLQVVEKRRKRLIRRREEFVLQMGKSVAVRVPGLVVAEIHLNQINARFHEPGSHPARPAERVIAVLLEFLNRSMSDIERFANSGIHQQRHRRLTMSIQTRFRCAAVQ